jgi:hypothetical protein
MKEFHQQLEEIIESMERKEQLRYSVSWIVRLAHKAKDLYDLKLENLFTQIIDLLEERPLDRASFKRYKVLLAATQKHVRDEYGWIMKGEITGQYMAYGVSFGLLVGVAFMTMNPAFIAIGLPIGIALGVSIGTSKENDLEDKGLLY